MASWLAELEVAQSGKAALHSHSAEFNESSVQIIKGLGDILEANT